jgi:hypothetical protein
LLWLDILARQFTDRIMARVAAGVFFLLQFKWLLAAADVRKLSQTSHATY